MSKIPMRSLLATSLMLCALSCWSQSPRLQLLEVFDNTTIPTDIAANVVIDPLMVANVGTITCLKYHVAWGSETGTDPMNLDNPEQAATRVAFYSITTDPHGVQDGGVADQGTFNGQPANLSQSVIDDRAPVTSPFTIEVSHTTSADLDSIYTHTVITRTGATTGTATVQVVVTEKVIQFANPPGLSGESVFLNVMKWMLPTAEGTPLAELAMGEGMTLDLAWELANVYDASQLAVVSFVQDDATQEVMQAGYSAPDLQPRDVGISAVQGIPDIGCAALDVELVLSNFGFEELTSATLNYQVDNDALLQLPWTGSLLPGASLALSVPSLDYVGMHDILAFTSDPNGVPDNVHYNDTTRASFIVASAPQDIPLLEGFEGAFPPMAWYYNNPHATHYWSQSTAGGFGASGHSAIIDFYDISAGNIHDLYAPVVDLSGITEPTGCSFNLAYAMYQPTYLDTLELNASADCGATWTNLWTKSGPDLATAPDDANLFEPTISQWRSELVDLSSFNGEAAVQLQFRAKSDYGNALYLDDINIGLVTGIEERGTSTMHISPNPFSDRAMVTFAKAIAKGRIQVVDLLGAEVMSVNFSGRQVVLEKGSMRSGIYVVRVNADGASWISGKVVVD